MSKISPIVVVAATGDVDLSALEGIASEEDITTIKNLIKGITGSFTGTDDDGDDDSEDDLDRRYKSYRRGDISNVDFVRTVLSQD